MKTLQNKALFWDINIKEIDLKDHQNFIIKRVIQYGDLTDWHWLKKNYSKDQIKKTLNNLRQAELRPSVIKLAKIIFY